MTSHSLIQQPDFGNNSGLDNFNVIYGREVLFRFQIEKCKMRIFLSIIHIKTLVEIFCFARCFVLATSNPEEFRKCHLPAR